MATISYFVFGPTALLSLYAFIEGPDKTEPVPENDWQAAKVDVVIPAYNERNTIALCLDSLMRQTVKPNRIVLIDDGSRDDTSKIALKFAAENNLPLEVLRHEKSEGKTVGLNEEAHALDGDVQFVLDADTVLVSENYIEEVVKALYLGAGRASACGRIMPLREKDRHAQVKENENVKRFYEENRDLSYMPDHTWYHRLARGITNLYREYLYFILQTFIYQGYMRLFGSIMNPVGCAVAYRREFIKKLFDDYAGTLGNNLTTSEDIFMGFAMQERGYHNVQVQGVIARSEEPEAQDLPKQIFLWSSSFLQSCYYFPDLLFSPFKFFRRWKKRRADKKANIEDTRVYKEPYRQAFGIDYTKEFGRPIGSAMALALFEKIVFPAVILSFIILQKWEPLFLTIAVETLLVLFLTLLVAGKGRKAKYVFLALITTPVRYLTIFFDVFTIGRFIVDLFVTKEREWRK